MIGLGILLSCQPSPVTFAQDPAQKLDTGIGFVIPKEVFNDPLYKITRAMFTKNLDTKFTVVLKEVKLTEMTLIEVNNLNPPFVKGDGTSSRETFSLVFQGPVALPLKQDTYTLEHSRLGTFKLLLVPGETARSGIRYAALINRVYP
jgi:hypothetical protein